MIFLTPPPILVLPCVVLTPPFLGSLLKHFTHLVRNQEFLVLRPTHVGLGLLDFLLAQGSAVCRRSVGLRWSADADGRLCNNQ